MALHRVDVHHHCVSPGVRAEVSVRRPDQVSIISWTPTRSIESMDEAGVAVSITSVAPPGIWFGDDGAAIRLAREFNEYARRLSIDYPGRFGNFAALPLTGVDASLREIEYAFDVLKADGVGLLTSYG